VHEEILKRQQLPPELVGKKIWDERFADITHFEGYLTRQGTIVLKFFLNLSREEQKMRFLKRLERPEKKWKFSASDVHERKFWGDYMHAFEEAIRDLWICEIELLDCLDDRRRDNEPGKPLVVGRHHVPRRLFRRSGDVEKKELAAARAELADQTS
jgi:hypothetical protein